MTQEKSPDSPIFLGLKGLYFQGIGSIRPFPSNDLRGRFIKNAYYLSKFLLNTQNVYFLIPKLSGFIGQKQIIRLPSCHSER